MQISLSTVKVLKTEFEKLLKSQEWCEILLKGNFYEFEKLLHQTIYELYDKICESVLNFISLTPDFVEAEKAIAKSAGIHLCMQNKHRKDIKVSDMHQD